jgi:DNA helicase-2/ATP-dependent DNA helicase PcrA
MTSFPPTPEQELILEAAVGTRDNLLIQALAGAAKTSTLVLIAKALPGRPILSVAFNKRIADEMNERLPSHCVSKTLNSIGHTAWSQHTGKKLTLDQQKTSSIIRGLDLSRSEQDLLRDCFSDVVQLVAKAKLFGYVPEGKYEEALHLISWDELQEVLSDAEYDNLAWALLDDILTRSISMAFNGVVDFDDQLYMSTLFGAQLPKFPLTMVDEAQDLSPLNHQMIAQLVGNRRLIAVGDHFQSIYGFRGAVSDGMSVLRHRFQMKEFTLTLSFRCPKQIILKARERAPAMKWADNAAEGTVTKIIRSPEGGVQWSSALFPRNCAVICRNNAPIFSLGLKLLAAGRGVTIRGMDVSKRLIKILKEFGDTSMSRDELIGHLDRWRQVKLAEGKLSEETIEDRYSCLVVFAKAAPTLEGAIAHAERLFSSEGPIELLSGHKAKGLEWNDVFHLDPWRIPSKFAKGKEQKEQELNLEYVITTRAKNSLTLIDLEDYDPELELPWVRVKGEPTE